jgi:hypothetical protein
MNGSMQLTALSAESTATGTALLRLSAIFRLKCNAGIPRTDARSLGELREAVLLE